MRRTSTIRAAARARTAGLGWALVGAGALLAGCAPAGTTEPVATDPASLAQLELAYTRELGSATARLDAAAHFVRYRAAEPKVDRAAVGGLLGFGADERVPLGACIADDDVAPSAAAMEISLLDAGAVELRARDASGAVQSLASLEPQHYPAILPFVSGVVYGLEAEPAPEVLPGERIEVEAQGGEDVGPFSTVVTAPEAFPELRAHHDAASGATLIEWTSLSDAKHDGVLVEVRWSGSHAGGVRCRARDEGHLVLPRAQTVGLDAALAEGQGAQVSVARSAHGAVSAPGVGAGTLTVTLRDTAPLSNESP